jgi:hypothetical protein
VLGSKTGRLPWWLETAAGTTIFGRERQVGGLMDQIQHSGFPTSQDAPVGAAVPG